MEFPQTLHDAIKYFSTGDNALNFVVSLRWPTGVVCPRCGSKEVRFLKSRKIWECSECESLRQFSAKVGTVMEDSPIKLDKWMSAFWLIANAKNGISSYELGRSIGVTQKSAWFMLHRIRLAMQDGSIEKFSGRVEADETFIGGKARNMHANKKTKFQKVRGHVGKVAVMGLLDRNSPERASRIKLRVVRNVRRGWFAQAHQKRSCHRLGSFLRTRFPPTADWSRITFIELIDHAECYAKGHVHTNGLENFWSLLKRGIKGTYVSIEPFHFVPILRRTSVSL